MNRRRILKCLNSVKQTSLDASCRKIGACLRNAAIVRSLDIDWPGIGLQQPVPHSIQHKTCN